MVSQKIYLLRKKDGLSQEQLAEKIHVSRQAISKWESGLSTPELDKLLALSACFHITLDELVKDEEPPFKTAEEKQAKVQQERPQSNPSPQPHFSKKVAIGISLCILGVIGCMILGILFFSQPSIIQQINASSAISITGSGIVFLLSICALTIGMVLILKKK